MAAILNAVWKAIPQINQHYKSVKSARNEIQCEYPFQRSFVNSTNVRTEFTYEGRIGSKLVFTAVTETREGLIIKFTRQYSEDAHRFLADLGHHQLCGL